MTNLLKALLNITKNPITELTESYNGSNRVNNVGEALEIYIKDAFCGTFDKDETTKNEIYSKYFSYLGNQNNPPDMIIRGGDAIEVKKIESLTAGLALNSSYPKNKLRIDDTRITEYCKKCENWTEKDIIYTVGVCNKNNKLKVLWFVYGDCYSADKGIYERVAEAINSGIKTIPNIQFEETNELARVNKVDPLGITYLRVRGMWHMEGPTKVFGSFVKPNLGNDLSIYAIILEEKYLSFPAENRKGIEENKDLQISNIKIKSPNNPANLLNAKLISYVK